MSTFPERTDQRILIRNVSWQTYEALLTDAGDHSAARLTFHSGDLEIMSPGPRHDRFKHRVGRLVVALAEELDIPIEGCGSMTIRRGDLARGLEPDEAFYITNEPLIRGKLDLDFDVDPPPDLAIEIDITHSSVDRFGIYAALGIPEVWQFDGAILRVFRLEPDGRYEPSTISPSFTSLPLGEFAAFIDPRPGEALTTWSKRFRAWVRERVLPLHQLDRMH